jgi:hypothetical protein
LRQFLRKIEEQYGKAERVWLMDRGHAACGMTTIMPHAGLRRIEVTLSLREPALMRHNLDGCSGPEHGLLG